MRKQTFTMAAALLLALCLAVPATFAAEKPNILVIWGDDVGYWNLSHINHGMMGYKASGKTFKVHSDGHSYLQFFSGRTLGG